MYAKQMSNYTKQDANPTNNEQNSPITASLFAYSGHKGGDRGKQMEKEAMASC